MPTLTSPSGACGSRSRRPRHDRVHLSKALEALENAAGADDSSEALTLFGRALLMASTRSLPRRCFSKR